MSAAAAPVPLVVRSAVAGDAEAMAALEPTAFPHPWSRAQLASELAGAQSLGLVAHDASGALAGYVIFRRVLDEAELLRLAVRREHQRLGLATALVARGLVELRAGGCAVAFLEVRADNDAAIRFYERTGWETAGRRSRYYPDGTDALLYRRALGDL
ncbi:MAG TPA: ribosomal protein S18-alanine N-acetyltransferase [Thermoanaerobaculia bacterium]|nr:ribosomal protein S18-alanine N-acetyltransferase [Thermoanaerobaculia bacterium]